MTSVAQRLEKVYALMEGEISVLQVEKRIRSASSARWRRPSASTI